MKAPLRTMEDMDPKSKKWNVKKAMNLSRKDFTLVTVQENDRDNHILALGGYDSLRIQFSGKIGMERYF